MSNYNWQPATARRKSLLVSRSDIARRVRNLKASLVPTLYFRDEVEQFTPRRDHGWENLGLCPFHADTRPGSFTVNHDSGAFRCFACDAAGGDCIAFHRLKYCLGFIDALRELEGRAGIWKR